VTVTSARKLSEFVAASTLCGSGRTRIARLGGLSPNQAEDLLRVSALIFVSFTAWNATSRFSAPIQLAHVADLRLRHRLQHARLEPRAALVSLASQNRHPRLVIGRPMSTPARPTAARSAARPGRRFSGGGRSLVSTI